MIREIFMTVSIAPIVIGIAIFGCGNEGNNTTRAVPDEYTWVGNTPLTLPDSIGVLANDPDGSKISSYASGTSNGGTVTMNAGGGFSYTPALGFSGTDTFTYKTAGYDGSTTVSIHIDAVVWYVDNTMGGNDLNGSFIAPFRTIADAELSASVGDMIYVFTGDGSSNNLDTGISLQIGQSLFGQGAALDYMVVDGTWLNIVPANSPPAIINVNGGGVVQMADNCVVAGLRIEGEPGVLQPGIVGSEIGGFTIRDNHITDSELEGISMLDVFGECIVRDNTISNNVANSGINIRTRGVDSLFHTTTNLTISGNVMSDIANDGIHLYLQYDTDGNFTIVDNEIINAGIVTGAGSAVVVHQTYPSITVCTIDSNRIVNFRKNGIDVAATGLGTWTTEILANRISGSSGVGSQNGIFMRTYARGTMTSSIRSNTIENCGSAGITALAEFPSQQEAIIESNTISNNGGTDFKGGIYLKAEQNGFLDAALINNTLQNNQNFGVSVLSAGGPGTSQVCLQATGNNSQAGFYLEGSRSNYGILKIEADDLPDFQATNTGSVNVAPHIDDLYFVADGVCGF